MNFIESSACLVLVVNDTPVAQVILARSHFEHRIGLAHFTASTRDVSCAKLQPMPLIIILIIVLLLAGGGGYYMGPGIGYYGGGGLSLILLIVILFLLFGRGRNRL